MSEQRDDKVRERAYEIWESEGRPEAQSEAHWTRACREIDAEAGTGDGSGQPPSTPGEGIDAIGEDGRSSAAEPLGRSDAG